ncbi:hypothetical protein VTI74DRAFT_11452 [Chaetomium olivicolor]
MSPNPKWEKNPVTNEWEWIERCDHGCCRSCTKDSQPNAGDPSRKDGRKGKESRKHRQNASSDVDPNAAYNITLDYSGKDARGSSKKEMYSKPSSRKN